MWLALKCIVVRRLPGSQVLWELSVIIQAVAWFPFMTRGASAVSRSMADCPSVQILCVCVCVCVCVYVCVRVQGCHPPTELSVASRPSVSSKWNLSEEIEQTKNMRIHMIKNCSVHTQTAWKLDPPKTTCPSFSQRQTSANMSFVFSVVIIWTYSSVYI